MNNSKQFGLTLIEMMIAMIIGLLITGVVIGLFISNVKSATENSKMTQLNQELRNVTSFMSDELKRAGFSSVGTDDYFQQLVQSPPECIIYAYDAGNTLANDTFGFKLENNAIKWGQAVTSCVDGNWESLTDPETAKITSFEYSLDIIPPLPTASVYRVLQLRILLTGEINLNPGTAKRTYAETIRIRNDGV